MKSYWYVTFIKGSGFISATIQQKGFLFHPVDAIKSAAIECNVDYNKLAVIYHKRISKSEYDRHNINNTYL